MKYKLIDNKIIFDKPIKKGKMNIKVFFTRFLDEREATDLPNVTTDSNGTKEYDVSSLQPFIIHTIHIRQTRLFGLLKGKWEIVEHAN
jgi:hypothetical protein